MNVLQNYYSALAAGYIKALDKSNEYKTGRMLADHLDKRKPEHKELIEKIKQEARRMYKIEESLYHLKEIEDILIEWGYKALEKFYPEKLEKMKPMFKDESPFIRVELIDILLNLKSQEHPSKTLKMGIYKRCEKSI